MIFGRGEHVVGRERRERVSHVDLSGDSCGNLRRRVYSTVRLSKRDREVRQTKRKDVLFP